jgi:hypothetical protein
LLISVAEICTTLCYKSNKSQDTQDMGNPQITISHFTDQSFLPAFRLDLMRAVYHIVILSPFLSRNRAAYYYPVLRSLVRHQVRVVIYAKPKQEQPESLRSHFDEVERNLKLINIDFQTRPGMHEKVGVIDNEILWHGSLNIFSHNNTKESMLRLECPNLAQEILLDLGLTTYKLATVNTTSQAVVPTCLECGQLMQLFENAGMWICSNSPTCSGTMPFDNAFQGSSISNHPKKTGVACPICSIEMEIKRGVFLRIGCPAPSCGFTLDPRLSTGLARVLRRRNSV